ncbi:MAG: hypothetical protein HQL65_19865 [Magnetococcales bacterium]|nr:hypothetical protein [Magnetococcales bacterium]
MEILLKSYYTKRLGFHAAIENEESMRYGALNAGGLGAGYGEYCAVLKAGFPEVEQNIAYLKSDSLNNYVDSAGHVDTNSLARDLAPDSHKCQLATIKHEKEIPTCPRKDWPSLVCFDKVYLEVIFTQPLTPASLSRVRISEKHVLDYESLAFKSVTSGLDEDEKIRSGFYMNILDLLRNQNILLEVIPS